MKTSQNGAIYKYLVGIKHQQTPFAFSENVVSGANEQIEVNTSKDIKGTVLAYFPFFIDTSSYVNNWATIIYNKPSKPSL